jgi:hypothetical protein
MKLAAGEQVVMSSDGNQLTLTTLRVTLDQASAGASRYISIPLDGVSSCGLVTRSFPILLLLAVLAAVGGFVLKQKEATVGGLVVGVILVIAYFVTRVAVINISPNGGESIVVPAKGMARDKVLEFLRAVEDAKLKFIGKA